MTEQLVDLKYCEWILGILNKPEVMYGPNTRQKIDGYRSRKQAMLYRSIYYPHVFLNTSFKLAFTAQEQIYHPLNFYIDLYKGFFKSTDPQVIRNKHVAADQGIPRLIKEMPTEMQVEFTSQLIPVIMEVSTASEAPSPVIGWALNRREFSQTLTSEETENCLRQLANHSNEKVRISLANRFGFGNLYNNAGQGHPRTEFINRLLRHLLADPSDIVVLTTVSRAKYALEESTVSNAVFNHPCGPHFPSEIVSVLQQYYPDIEPDTWMEGPVKPAKGIKTYRLAPTADI